MVKNNVTVCFLGKLRPSAGACVFLSVQFPPGGKTVVWGVSAWHVCVRGGGGVDMYAAGGQRGRRYIASKFCPSMPQVLVSFGRH